MRVPRLVRDFFEWRWAPCVGLTAGSLAFVALALLLIPTRIGREPAVVSTLSAFESPRSQRAIFSSALARSANETEEYHASDDRHVARSAPPPTTRGVALSAAPQRGFSPIIERPETLPALPATAEPAAPASVPAAPSAAVAIAAVGAVTPPPAATGNVVVIQPEPGGPAREANER